MTGTIVRIDWVKGFGFIKGDDDGVDRFFHRSGLEQTTLPFDDLAQNMRVVFTHVDGPKGPRAVEVRVV